MSSVSPRIGVCLKWVDQRPELDAVTGAVHVGDERFGGVSPSDRAALEWALRCAEMWGGEVLVVSFGPAGAAGVLRDALAVGATRVVRVDADTAAPSEIVAERLAGVLHTCDLVWCGDYSADRGSGAVPALIAAHRGVAQALGLVGIELAHDDPGSLTAVRRLDGGRRERLGVTGPAVLSVEGSTASLRRASLVAALGVHTAPVDVVPGPRLGEHPRLPTRAYRPRARALAAPVGDQALDRIRSITAADASADTRGETVELEPRAAAERIVAALEEWGYLS
jgi:electron transfer flavoprotein beta subunit